MPLIVVHDAAALKKVLGGRSCALTPTMGGLHEGHLSLARRARQLAEVNVVSIYVNPLQFGGGEDFERYPRNLQKDCEKLEGEADIVFAPRDMFSQAQTVTVALPPLASQLCGRFRPGFFEGVATVVCKLFNCARPQAAVFGLKDFQQLHIIRQMVRQFNFDIKIIDAPIVREADGLAMSSRNVYLTARQRQQATLLPQTLQAAARMIENQEATTQEIERIATQRLQDGGFVVDYVEARDYETLESPPCDRVIILAAATLGETRLIDNIACKSPSAG